MQRFFLQYRNKTCTRQNVGKEKIGIILQEIAKFFNLLEAEKYTGHAFRRTSATLITDKKVDVLTLKRHQAWKSSTVFDSYIIESIKNKKDMSNLILTSITINNKQVIPATRNALSNIINSMQESHYAGPSTSKSTILAQIEVNEMKNITQDELKEVVETDFYSNKNLKSSKSKINDNLIDGLENISQE